MNLPNSGLEIHVNGVGDINAIIVGNWQVINNYANPAAGLTGSQSGNTFTSSGDVFTAADVGAYVLYADGSSSQITGYTSGISVDLNTSQAKPSQAYIIFRPDQDAYTFLARALMKVRDVDELTDGITLVWDSTLRRFKPNNASAFDNARGTASIGSGVDTLTVTGLALSFTPTAGVVTVISPSGGYVISAVLEKDSIDEDGFKVNLSALTDSADYKIAYFLF